MNTALIVFFAIAVTVRLYSLYLSKRNEARLRVEGAREYGAGNTRLLAALHTVYYVAAFAEGMWRGTGVDVLTWAGMALYGASMLVLARVIHELGGFWTVKLLISPDHALKQGWLFRAMRHPNYYLNILPELMALALIMNAWIVLVVVFPFYLATLYRRIRLEEKAMSQRFPDYL